MIAEARRRFAGFRADPSSLPPGLRQPVLDIAGGHADARTLEALKQLVHAAKDAQAQQQYLHALARVEQPALAQDVMAYALTADVPTSLPPPCCVRRARTIPSWPGVSVWPTRPISTPGPIRACASR